MLKMNSNHRSHFVTDNTALCTCMRCGFLWQLIYAKAVLCAVYMHIQGAAFCENWFALRFSSNDGCVALLSFHWATTVFITLSLPCRVQLCHLPMLHNFGLWWWLCLSPFNFLLTVLHRLSLSLSRFNFLLLLFQSPSFFFSVLTVVFGSLVDSFSHAILFRPFSFPSKRRPFSRWSLNYHVPTLPQAYLKFHFFNLECYFLIVICHTLYFPSIVRQVCRMTLWFTCFTAHNLVWFCISIRCIGLGPGPSSNRRSKVFPIFSDTLSSVSCWHFFTRCIRLIRKPLANYGSMCSPRPGFSSFFLTRNRNPSPISAAYMQSWIAISPQCFRLLILVVIYDHSVSALTVGCAPLVPRFVLRDE